MSPVGGGGLLIITCLSALATAATTALAHTRSARCRTGAGAGAGTGHAFHVAHASTRTCQQRQQKWNNHDGSFTVWVITSYSVIDIHRLPCMTSLCGLRSPHNNRTPPPPSSFFLLPPLSSKRRNGRAEGQN